MMGEMGIQDAGYLAVRVPRYLQNTGRAIIMSRLALSDCSHDCSARGEDHVANQTVIHGNMEVLMQLLKQRRQRAEDPDGAAAPPLASLTPLTPLDKSAKKKKKKKISARYQNTINENLKILGGGNAQFEVLIFGERGSKSLSVYSANQHAIARNIERLARYLEKEPNTRIGCVAFRSIRGHPVPFPDTRLPAELCLNQVYINEMLFDLARALDGTGQPTREMRRNLPTTAALAGGSCVIL